MLTIAEITFENASALRLSESDSVKVPENPRGLVSRKGHGTVERRLLAQNKRFLNRLAPYGMPSGTKGLGIPSV